jgi:hypothetical protein
MSIAAYTQITLEIGLCRERHLAAEIAAQSPPAFSRQHLNNLFGGKCR